MYKHTRIHICQYRVSHCQRERTTVSYLLMLTSPLAGVTQTTLPYKVTETQCKDNGTVLSCDSIKETKKNSFMT